MAEIIVEQRQLEDVANKVHSSYHKLGPKASPAEKATDYWSYCNLGVCQDIHNIILRAKKNKP